MKLAFITGASSGIGQALALRFYKAGYRLALVVRREQGTQSWAKACGIRHKDCEIYSADAADINSLIAAAHTCMAHQGLPDVVVANAGMSVGVDTSLREDLDVMAQILQVNTLGVAATFSPFIAPMLARGHGTLVGMGSVAGIRGLPGHGAYCASKAGVISYCESLRGELRPQGVKVVTLCPGYVDTPMTKGNPYPMPFLMTPAAFADKAFRAIESGASYRVIPWQMGVLAKLLRCLPNALFDWALQGQPRDRKSVV